MKVKRRSEFTVSLTKDGYEPVQTIVMSTVDGVGSAGMLSNVLLGGVRGVGLIGAGIDAGTGATHTHSPNPLRLDLVAVENG